MDNPMAAQPVVLDRGSETEVKLDLTLLWVSAVLLDYGSELEVKSDLTSLRVSAVPTSPSNPVA
jgi:hypothetical protein